MSEFEGLLLEPKPLEQDRLDMIINLVEQRMPHLYIPEHWQDGAYMHHKYMIGEDETVTLEFYINEETDDYAPPNERICIIKHTIEEWNYNEEEQTPDAENKVLIGMDKTRVYTFLLDTRQAMTLHEIVSYKREVGDKSFSGTESKWNVTDEIVLNTDHTEELSRILDKIPIVR